MPRQDANALIHRGEEATAAVLQHARPYDPVAAREYYLRTRKLKGRHPAAQAQPSAKKTSGAVGAIGSGGGASNAEMRPSRRKKLEAEKAKLEKRLEELKRALQLLVDAAKKRAGVDPEEEKDPKETADKNEKNKKDKPLTEKQKREKREAAREQYEKEKGMGLSREVQQLQEQVKDIRAKLEAAIADARETEKRRKSKPKGQLQSTNQTASISR